MKLPAGVRVNNNGKYECRFTMNGKRYSVYGNTVKEVRAKELARRKEIEEGTYSSGKKQTLDDYFQKWVDGRDKIVKGSTWRSYFITMRALKAVKIDKAGHSIFDLKLEDIEVQHCRKVQNELAMKYDPSGVNKKMGLIKQLLAAAMNERLINWNPANPVKPIRNDKTKARETIHRALTFEETEAFLEAAKDDWNYQLFVFLLNTGLRIGEAGALKPSDISEDSVFIHRTIAATVAKCYEITDSVKSAAGRRNVPLTDDAKEAIREQKELNDDRFGGGNITSFPGADIDEQPIFRSINGRVLSTAQVDYRIGVICKKAGIERFTAHCFRDTFATRAIESGMAPKTLQEILGHSDISMTMNLYAHCMEETKRQQMMVVKVRKSS